jgi:hypothetical protein
MRISVKTFLAAVIAQLLLFLLVWLTSGATDRSGLDTLNGFLSLLIYLLYLIPIGMIYEPTFGSAPVPSTLPLFLIGLAALFYAFLIGLLFGFFRKPKNSR